MSAKHADAIFLEIASLGEASVRRIYGDFEGGGPQGWTKHILSAHAIIPHQQFAHSAKKNASDIALVIDAMDILHSGRFNGFVLVSSDSDFTRLASRIREQGLDVYGIGESKTPDALRKAYKKFILVENIGLPDEVTVAEKEKSNPPSKARPMIRAAIDAADTEGVWVPLGQLGNLLNAADPSFDARAYGCPNLSTLAKKAGTFEVREIDNVLKIRIKPNGGNTAP